MLDDGQLHDRLDPAVRRLLPDLCNCSSVVRIDLSPHSQLPERPTQRILASSTVFARQLEGLTCNTELLSCWTSVAALSRLHVYLFAQVETEPDSSDCVPCWLPERVASRLSSPTPPLNIAAIRWSP